MSEERWKEIDGFQGHYEVSDQGRVRSVARIDSSGKHRKSVMLKLSKRTKDKYRAVALYKKCIKTEAYVHRLVAQAFIPNPDGLPQVNHIDGVGKNNDVSNLEWVTNQENTIHARRVLLIGVRPIYGVCIHSGKRTNFSSFQQAREADHIPANIDKCLKGTRKKHHDHLWFDAAIDAAIQGEQE